MAAPWRALPLIRATFSDNGTVLKVSSDARDALLLIHAQHVGVLGVFGAPATGKRLLLNTLLQPQDVDFSAPSEGNSDVLLWLWLPQADGRKDGDTARVVLATGAALEAEQAENQRLALLLLLSSALLYNADGEIDAEAVERLQWVEKVAQVLRIKGMQDEEAVGECGKTLISWEQTLTAVPIVAVVSATCAAASEFHDHAPKFVWLARKFKLKWLKGSEGQS